MFSSMKEAMMRGIEEILAEAFELSFQAANIGKKGFLPRFGEECDTYNLPMDTGNHTDEELRPFVSSDDAFMNALVNKLSQQQALAQNTADPTARIIDLKLEYVVEKKDENVIDLLPSETESLSKTSYDNMTIWGGPCCCKEMKEKKKSCALRKARKSKME